MLQSWRGNVTDYICFLHITAARQFKIPMAAIGSCVQQIHHQGLLCSCAWHQLMSRLHLAKQVSCCRKYVLDMADTLSRSALKYQPGIFPEPPVSCPISKAPARPYSMSVKPHDSNRLGHRNKSQADTSCSFSLPSMYMPAAFHILPGKLAAT